MQTKLTWQNKPLGPCAELCYRETVVVKALNREFKFLNKKIGFFPSNCVREVYGNPRNPRQVTMRWKSPILYDFCWIIYSHALATYIQTNLKVGDIVAEKQHKYQFYGTDCKGFEWGPLLTEVRLKLVVQEAKDAAGNPVPINGKNVLVPVWEIESQTP